MTHQKRESVKTIIKVIAFIVFGVLFLSFVLMPFKVHDERIKPLTYALRKQPKNSIDCAFIGGSQTYCGWTPPFAYLRYGMTSWTYAIPHAPAVAVKYYIEEVRKTQPDALFVIATNTYKEVETPLEFMHHTADYMPLSLNKLHMVNAFRKTYGLSNAEAAELLFPFVRFHSGWDELTTDDYVQDNVDLKCGSSFITFFSKEKDYSSLFQPCDTERPIEPEFISMIDDLLEYLENNKVRALFVTYPQVVEEYTDAERNLAIRNYVAAKGWDTLDLMNDPGLFGFDYSQDLYNQLHANVHGSMKFTSYLAKYIIDKYKLDLKHTEAVDADWEKSCSTYMGLADDFLMDFEIHGFKRNYDLDKPSFLGKLTDETGVHITWGAVEGADGYAIYKKLRNTKGFDLKDVSFSEFHSTTQSFRLSTHEGKWEYLADVKDGCSYTDSSMTSIKLSKKYRYNVVPYTEVDGVKQYGKFNYHIAYIKQNRNN